MPTTEPNDLAIIGGAPRRYAVAIRKTGESLDCQARVMVDAGLKPHKALAPPCVKPPKHSHASTVPSSALT